MCTSSYILLQPDPGVHHLCLHHHILGYSLTQEYITCVYIIIYCVLQPDPGVHHVCVHHDILCVTA